MKWPWDAAWQRAKREIIEDAHDFAQFDRSAWIAEVRPLLVAAGVFGPDRVKIEAGERLRCLQCSAPGPFATGPTLRSYALRDGKLISEETHARLSCQRCAAQFTVGPEGAFWHHEDAQPWTGERLPPSKAPVAGEAPPQERMEAPWPTARPKPPV